VTVLDPRSRRWRIGFAVLVAAFASIVVRDGSSIRVSVNGARAREASGHSAQTVLAAAERFAEMDKRDVAPFWDCIMRTPVDVGTFQNADQIAQRIEKVSYPNKAFSETVAKECAPKLVAAREAATALWHDVPAALKAPLEKYVAALPKMQTGILSYAKTLKTRGAVKDVDSSIQEVGAAFTMKPTAESVAFEKFMVCAIPDLDKKDDLQAVLGFMAETCKDDAVSFMTRVRKSCGPLVMTVNANAAPSKTFAGNAAKFYEQQQRQLQAWEWCSKKSRKGKTISELDAFLSAAGDYIEARAEVVKAARTEAARLDGPSPRQ